MPEVKKLRILAIGAHPDDCDLKAGATGAMYAQRGHEVLFLSMTNGDTGHHEIGGVELARRRYREAKAAAALAGIEYQCLDIHSGELFPTLENRRTLIRLLREFAPDLVMTHRPNDYHPDHRYASQLVQDAMYLVTVPNNTSLTPHLQNSPIAVYFNDDFRKPNPFTADVAIDVAEAFEKKIDMLDCHESQMYEWLPYNSGKLHEVPQDAQQRRAWLAGEKRKDVEKVARDSREALIRLYGEKRAESIWAAESYEVCEYGTQLPPEKIGQLFPFFD